MLFLIEAKVVTRVAGISGNFTREVSKLVNANNVPQAKTKFEGVIRGEMAHVQADSIQFEYSKIADEIK